MLPTYQFELRGETAILFHADDVLEGDRLKAWRTNSENANASVAGDDRSPPWTWQTYLYHDGENIGVPTDNIMKALCHAGAKIKTGKGQTTFKSLSQSGLMIDKEFGDFFGPDGKQVPIAAIRAFADEPFAEHCRRAKDFGFSLFVKRAKLPSSGAKHVRVRARFDDWTVTGQIVIVDNAISFEVLDRMFEYAGRYSGLMDWRPSSPKAPGNYGQFTHKFTPIKQKKSA